MCNQPIHCDMPQGSVLTYGKGFLHLCSRHPRSWQGKWRFDTTLAATFWSWLIYPRSHIVFAMCSILRSHIGPPEQASSCVVQPCALAAKAKAHRKEKKKTLHIDAGCRAIPHTM